MTEEAYVTLVTNDSYSQGALVLAASLRAVKTSRAIVCLITNEVSSPMREVLGKLFDNLYLVDLYDSRDSAGLALLERPDLGVTFTKLHCWTLEQYKKCVFLDADTLVLQNCDELFEREELSAAPDPGWPDCFNSGVFVFCPSKDTYRKLLDFARKEGSFDGGDQGLLNLYFKDWAYTDIRKHLPFIYNVVSQAFYSYLPAFRRFGTETKICHFIGAVKPWHLSCDPVTGLPSGCSGTGFNPVFLSRWWTTFRQSVAPLLLQNKMDHMVSQFSAIGTRQPASNPTEHRMHWEQGNIDYTGFDSFDNIKRHIDAKLAAPSDSAADPDVRPKAVPQQLAPSSYTDSKQPKKSSLKKPKEQTD